MYEVTLIGRKALIPVNYNITLHIGNIFKEGELEVNSVRKESLLTAADGKKYRTKFYNLDVIISVGYRVKSQVGTRFRQWLCRAGDYVKLKGCSIYFCNPFLINHFT